MTTKRFTGQHHESALPGGEGLSYYGARWYDAKLGRFLSADTIVPGPANPQAFNRYSYVLNAPTNRIDPTGHYDVKPGDAPWWNKPKGTVPHTPWILKFLNLIPPYTRNQETLNKMYGEDLGGNDILGMTLIQYDHYRMLGKTPPAGLQLTHEWYHELGAQRRTYGPDYEITQWLSGKGYSAPAKGVQQATDRYWAEGDIVHPYSFGFDFFAELREALDNGQWSGSFLGSYSVKIETIQRKGTDVSLVRYTVENKTGWLSATRYPSPAWVARLLGFAVSTRPDVVRSAPGKGGLMVQFYVWEETIHR